MQIYLKSIRRRWCDLFSGVTIMAEAQQLSESDPLHHTVKIRGRLDELIEHLREDVEKVSEPKAQTLFETSAEVLGGLRKAFQDYEAGTEPGMRR